MKSLKEGTSDELFVPEEDTYKKTTVVYRGKQEMKLYREGWNSYKKLKTQDERKDGLLKIILNGGHYINQHLKMQMFQQLI